MIANARASPLAPEAETPAKRRAAKKAAAPAALAM